MGLSKGSTLVCGAQFSCFDQKSVEMNSTKPFFLLRFESTQRQARRLVVLRDNESILAYPQYFRGNLSISEHTIKSVVQFYREDGISRVSASSQDTLQIHKKSVPVRFMEMNILEAFRTFNKRHHGIVARSSFYSLRPREVKISSPHDTCMCIYHENMSLLLQVCAAFLFLCI